MAEQETEVDPQYPHAPAWVEGWLAANLERRIDTDNTGQGALWCPKWWDHPEARNLLYALWRDWEVAWAVDSLVDWWGTFNQHWVTLTGEAGPFHRCHGGHQRPDPLRVEPMPEDMLEHFPDFDPGQV